MISNLDENNNELINEVVNFIFIKQNSKNYSFTSFPKDLYNIRKELRINDVYYIKEEKIDFVLIRNKEIIKFIYFRDKDILLKNIEKIQNLSLMLNKENQLQNILTQFSVTNKRIYTMKLELNNENLKKDLNSTYLIIPLQKYLFNEYKKIHSEKIYKNCNNLVCIKNNELIGYMDYKNNNILEFGTINSKDYSTVFTQILLKLLGDCNVKRLYYQVIDCESYQNCISVGFEVIEETLNLIF